MAHPCRFLPGSWAKTSHLDRFSSPPRVAQGWVNAVPASLGAPEQGGMCPGDMQGPRSCPLGSSFGQGNNPLHPACIPFCPGLTLENHYMYFLLTHQEASPTGDFLRSHLREGKINTFTGIYFFFYCIHLLYGDNRASFYERFA